MRFLTITCNPAIDTTYLIDRLTPGAINRVERVLPAAGGKGNNVARVLARLGHTPTATGFAGGHTGRFIEDGLRAAGVEPAFVAIDGASRICLTVVERMSGRTTEIREPGSVVTNADVNRLLVHVADLARATDVAVISGSLPPGAPADLYARLIGVLKAANVYVTLDSSGEPLRSGAAACPDLIKPNREELGDLLMAAMDSYPTESTFSEHPKLIGVVVPENGMIVVSQGADGAILLRRSRSYRATPPRIEAINTVGAGDALLAGFLHARATGMDDRESLAFAVATGTASALAESVGAVEPNEIERLRAKITISNAASTVVGVTA
jgi:tagatose 6-phosphate kinase